MAEVQNIDPKRKLFDALSNEKYYTKSYEDFDKQFSTPESVGKLYLALNKGGYYTKTQKDFEGTFFPKSNEVSTQGSKNTSQISTEPSVISQSNPFGKVPTAKTIDVATGKTGTTKISIGSNKTSLPKNYEANLKKELEQRQRNDIGNYWATSMREAERRAVEESEFWNNANPETVGQQLRNSAKNIATGLKKVIPQLNIASTDVLEAIMGKELAEDAYKLEGRDIGQVRLEAYREMADLDAQMLKTSGSISDNIKYLNGSGLIVNLADALGSIVTTGIPAILTAGGATIPSIVGQSIADYNNSKANSKGISVKELYETGQAELKTPLLIGSLAGALELVGLKSVKNLASGTIKGAGAKKIARYAIETNKEGLTEVIQGGLEEVNKVKSEGGTDDQAASAFFESVTSKKGLDEYLMGLFASGGVGAISHISKTITNYDTKKVVDENINKLADIQKDLENQNIPTEAKTLLEREAKKIIKSTSTVIDKEDINIEKLSQEDKVKNEELNLQKEQLEVSLAEPNISEEGKKIIQQQIDKVDEQLSEIKPPKVETTQDVKITEEVTTPTEVKSTEKVIVEVGNVEYETDGTYVSEKGSGNLMPLDSDVSVKVLEKYSEIKPTETKVEGVKVTEDVKTTPVEGVSGGATEGVTPTLTPTQETVQVKPRFTIKGETVTPKIEQVVPNAVQEQEAVPQSEDVEVSGIKKSLVSKEVVDKVDFDKISDKEFTELGKKLHETGEVKSKDIVKEIVGYTNKEGKKTEGNRRALQPSEVVALLYYKTDLDNQERDLLKKKNSILEKGGDTSSVDAELNEVQDNIFDFDQMALITADQQSLAFRLRKGLIDKDYNYVTQVEKYKATNKGVIPADVEAKFKEYDARLKELKEEIRVAEERARIAEENQAVNNITEDVKRSQKTEATKRKRAEANLQKAKDEFSEFLRKSRGQVNSFADVATFVKQASKLIKAYADLGIVKIEEVVAEMRKDYGDKFVDENIKNINQAYETVNLDKTKPYIVDGQLTVPSRYIRGLVESGVTDINSISEQVLAEVQKDLPDATIREVRDAITRYGKTVNQTADAITTQINQAKSLGKLYSKLEDLQKGIIASKTATRTTKLTKEQIEIKKQIKVLEDALPKTEEQIEADNTKRLEAKKRYYKKFIEEKQQRLKDRNFAPKPKNKPIVPDDELSKLQAKANEVRAKYDEAHFENEQTNRPLGKKIYDESLEWLTGLTRALQAGLDLSAFGVQLAIYTSSTTPSKVLETVKQSLKFLSSEKYEKEFFAKIETHPLYPVMKASGLALQYPNSKLGSRDYQLSGSAINKVYNAMVFPLKYINPKLYERAILFNPYRATERAFTGAIDTARIQMFTEFAKDLEQNGISFENNPEQYKIAAEATNNLTFRGKLGRLEGVSRELAVVFFAPRKVAASLALVNPIYYAQVGMGSKTVAKRLLLKMATFISMATMITLLIKASQDDEDEDSNPDVFNPYSSDFMKVRIGKTRIDMFGGLNQNIVLFARLIMGLYKKTYSYKTEELGGAPFVPTRLGLTGQFTKNKLSPTASLVTKYLDQSKGREVDWDTEAVESVSPMWTTSIEELYKEHPTEMASFLTFMALIGQSMNTYGTAEFLDKDKDKKYIDLLARKNGAFQNRTRASIKIIDEGTGEERGIDRVEYEVYKKEFGDYIKSDLKARYKELDNMTLPEFEKELKKIKKNAKEFAEFKLTNSLGDLDKINQTVKGKQVNYVLTPEQVRQRLKYNDSYVSKFGNKSMPIRIKKFMQRDKLTKELAEKEALIEMNKSANKYSERMLFRDYRAGKIKLEIKE